jgi:hypothetical protein
MKALEGILIAQEHLASLPVAVAIEMGESKNHNQSPRIYMATKLDIVSYFARILSIFQYLKPTRQSFMHAFGEEV